MTARVVVIVVTILGMVGSGGAAELQSGRGERARGKAVRVKAADGRVVTGNLVSLSDSTVVLSKRGIVSSFPLDDVRRVDLVSGHIFTGALAGFGAGVVIGMAGSEQAGYSDDGVYTMPLIFGGMGLVVGSVVGALAKAATAERRVLYRANRYSARVIPVATPDAVALCISVSW